MKNILFIVIVLMFSLDDIEAQKFSEQAVPFSQLEYAKVESADFDNDGDYDCLVCGSNTSYNVECHLYKNNGDFNFEEVNIDLPGVSGTIACQDYDFDGDVDLLLSGYKKNSYGAKRFTYVYKNNGNNQFVDIKAFTDSVYKNPIWVDYDKDGDMDISCYRFDSSKYYILENLGNDKFVQSVQLPREVSLWYDVNKDGFNDYVSYSGQLFLYDKGTFTASNSLLMDSLGANFEYSRTPFSFEDFNCDGKIDLLLSRGWNEYNPHVNQSHMMISNTNLYDSIVNSSLIGITSQGDQQIIDIENDGDLDILITGCCNGDDAKLYRNDSIFKYVSVPFFLSTIYNTSSNWADFDGDEDLDILISGNNYLKMVKLFENDTVITNASPSKPSNLKIAHDSCYTIFSWDKSSDDKTPVEGLFYNIHIGTEENPISIVSPNVNMNNGQLLYPHKGNCGHNNFYIIKDLDTTKIIHWGVQAIDYLYKTSDFSEEKYVSSVATQDSSNDTTSDDKCVMKGILQLWDSIQIVDISNKGIPSNPKTIQLEIDLDEYPSAYNSSTKNFIVFTEDYSNNYEESLFIINSETSAVSVYYYGDSIYLSNIIYDWIDNKVYAMAAYYITDEDYEVYTVSINESTGELTKIVKVDTAHELDEWVYSYDPNTKNFAFIYYPTDVAEYHLNLVNLNTGKSKVIKKQSVRLDCFSIIYDVDSNSVYILEDSINIDETESIIKLYRVDQNNLKYEFIKNMGKSLITYPYSSNVPAYNQENKTVYLTDVNELENDYAIVMYDLEKGKITINDSLEHKYGGYIHNINYNCTVTDAGEDSIPFISGDTISITACKKYIFNGDTLFNSGFYTYTLGSDSAITLNLTILGWPIIVNKTVCDSFEFDGKYLTKDGLYIAKFKSSMECDSIVYLKLKIDNDPHCGDTVTSVSNSIVDEISVFPNPSNGQLNLKLDQLHRNVKVKIVSITGQTFFERSYLSTTFESIDLGIPKGLYFVVISSDGLQPKTFRLVRN